MVYALGLEAIRQAALKRLGMAGSHKLVLGGTTLLLRALGGKQVTETGRAAHELTSGGELEALGDGLFGLLHGESGRKQREPPPFARGKLAKLARESPIQPCHTAKKHLETKKAVDKTRRVLSVLASQFSVS